MSLPRALLLHTGLLVFGAAAATWAYTREKTPQIAQESEVTLLSGRPADIQRVVYDAKGKKVVVEPNQVGSTAPYYFVTVQKEASAPIGADAGAQPRPAPTLYVSNDPGKKLFEALAPLRASRSIGKVAPPKDKEYGLDHRDVSLAINVSGLERHLSVGDTAPGGGDSYVLDVDSGQAYVVRADFLHDLDAAESKLAERDLHAWKDVDAKSAKIMAGGKTREIVRGGPDNRRFWADPASRDKPDETAVNWLQKVDRLKGGEYSRTQPTGATSIVRVEFAGASSSELGHFELFKVPDPAQAGKSIYWVQTERTHVPTKVASTFAEQVEQDLPSVLK